MGWRSIREWVVARRRGVVLGLCLVGLVGLADHATGFEIDFSAIYLAPVALVTWSGGTPAGLVAAVASAAVEVTAEFTSNKPYGHPAIPLWNGFVDLATFAVFVWILGVLKRTLEREQDLARSDSLTGLANLHRFHEVLEWEVARSRRYGHPLSIAYLDCDDFKRVNDTVGHSDGDALLRALADGLRAGVRDTDLVARIGGDEFVLLLPETDGNAAEALIRRLHDRVTRMLRARWDVGISIGLVTWTSLPETIEETVAAADRLMYAGKQTGKGCVVVEVRTGTRPVA